MKKILYFDWFQSATEFYRSSGIFPYINNPNFTITRSTENNISFATLVGYDAIILERPSSHESLNIIKLAKDMHIKVIIDYDDDIIHIDEYNPMYETYQQQMPTAIQCLVLADEIWVTTKGLKKAFSLYNKNIHVIPNAHNDYVFKVEDKKVFNPDNKLAVWRGGSSHEGDIYDIGVPEMIINVVNSNTDWTFKVIGQRFKYLEKRCGDNYISQGGSSTIQFYKMLHDENPAIVFYPLADTVFNRSKSNICWLESSFAGACFFGNVELPEFKNDHIADIKSFFTHPLSDLDMDTCDNNNHYSWQYILDNLLLSDINGLRENRLLEI